MYNKHRCATFINYLQTENVSVVTCYCRRGAINVSLSLLSEQNDESSNRVLHSTNGASDNKMPRSILPCIAGRKFRSEPWIRRIAQELPTSRFPSVRSPTSCLPGCISRAFSRRNRSIPRTASALSSSSRSLRAAAWSFREGPSITVIGGMAAPSMRGRIRQKVGSSSIEGTGGDFIF